jgi:uncharacterized damage-inducible protein DinB
MDIATLKLFAKYNEMTNRKMNELILTLSEEQWNMHFGGFFSSIKSLCNHIYISDFNWLKRFAKLREFDFCNASVFKENIQFGTIVIETIKVYETKRNELDEYIKKFINEITDKDINSVLEYTDSHGTMHKKNIDGLILHMFNHETHHRGMISIYLEEMKIDNNYSNLADIL